MEVGDLVRHIFVKDTRQIGVITATKWLHNQERWKYKVLWIAEQKEEYWFTNEEVEVI